MAAFPAAFFLIKSLYRYLENRYELQFSDWKSRLKCCRRMTSDESSREQTSSVDRTGSGNDGPHSFSAKFVEMNTLNSQTNPMTKDIIVIDDESPL